MSCGPAYGERTCARKCADRMSTSSLDCSLCCLSCNVRASCALRPSNSVEMSASKRPARRGRPAAAVSTLTSVRGDSACSSCLPLGTSCMGAVTGDESAAPGRSTKGLSPACSALRLALALPVDGKVPGCAPTSGLSLWTGSGPLCMAVASRQCVARWPKKVVQLICSVLMTDASWFVSLSGSGEWRGLAVATRVTMPVSSGSSGYGLGRALLPAGMMERRRWRSPCTCVLLGIHMAARDVHT